MILQGAPPAPPIPPPPIGPQFDPNLIFLQDGGPPVILLIVIAALTATVIILWPIMRAFGRRLEGRGSTDVALKGEIDHLHARLSEMDSLQSRVLELEERVDFTERLLAQGQSPGRLGGSEGSG
ncbi:MAG TPA: hypothetical protein VKA25_02575 [Gemmatimonadales bacterium]|nr:hypothetical protein [Gemmatimonadales bacterium]